MNQRKPRVEFRPVHGIVLLDKEQGISSNGALQKVRFALRAAKGGHTGALDPLATGMLPLCFGEASKIAGYLLGNDKAYETVARLGRVTDTDDADGQVIRERPIPGFDRRQIEAMLATLTGSIAQKAPIYSALKQGGEPLYAKARRGEPVEAPTRQVHVHSIEVLELTEQSIRLRIVCGSGTYIRSIVRDLGEMLGCGAHVEMLRRLWVSPFKEVPMHSAETIVAAIDAGNERDILLPIEQGLSGWERVVLSGAQVRELSQGKQPQGAFAVTERALAMTEDGVPLGLVQVAADGRVKAQRLFSWIGDPALQR